MRVTASGPGGAQSPLFVHPMESSPLLSKPLRLFPAAEGIPPSVENHNCTG